MKRITERGPSRCGRGGVLALAPLFVFGAWWACGCPAAEIIPPERRVDWKAGITVGVPGGIPTNRTRLIDVTKAPYNADKTGVTNASPAIQSAINAAAINDVVYLPAGTYRLNSQLNIGTKSGITVRGAGAATLVKLYGSTGFVYVGSGSDYLWSWPPSGNAITAGFAKGSTKITVADTSAFAVGQIVQISVANDAAVPVVSVSGYQNLRRQKTRVTAKTATTLSIFPPLYSDYGGGRLAARVNVAQLQANLVGIEDLTIDAGNSTYTFLIYFEQCYGCWVKNVKSRLAYNYHVFLYDCLNCEVRKCYLDELNHTGSNGAALLVNTSSACLVEDNVIYKAFPSIEVNHGSSGNVFAYNLCEDSTVFGVEGVAIDTNHGPHNSFNLYEGNVAPNIQCDGYFGSASEDTLFRNWLHGHEPGSSNAGWVLSLNRFTRNYSVVGNVLGMTGPTWPSDGVSLGNPNMGNGDHTGTAQPSAGDWWKDWNVAGTLTARTDNTNGTATLTSGSVASGLFPIAVWWNGGARYGMTSGTVSNGGTTVPLISGVNASGNNLPPLNTALTLWVGPPGFQELDLDVAATLLRKGNWNAKDGTVPAAESLNGAALPMSLFRSSRPPWFGKLKWPPFDPGNPNQTYDAIPAGYRYQHGVDP